MQLPAWATVFLLISFLLHRTVDGWTQCPKGSQTKERVENYIKNNYTKRLPDANGAVNVTVDILVLDILSMNEQFDISILFSERWVDPALAFHKIGTGKHPICKRVTVDSNLLRNIWKPETCVTNSENIFVPKTPNPNIMLEMDENGAILVLQRLQIRAPCDGDLRRFPFDRQKCTLVLESFSYSSDEVTLDWLALIVLQREFNKIPDVDLVEVSTGKENFPYPSGPWDQLKADFVFARRFGSYVRKVYIPSGLTVLISFLGFCLKPNALLARTLVAVGSLLGLILQISNVVKISPRTKICTMMDTWTFGCFVFICTTIIEFAVVFCLHRNQEKERPKEGKLSSDNSIKDESTQMLMTEQKKRDVKKCMCGCFRNVAMMDKILGGLILIAFILFNNNIAYWTYSYSTYFG